MSRRRAERAQRRHHRAFRIDQPVWHERDRELIGQLLRARPPEPDQAAHTESTLDDKALADAVTSLWRAQRKLAERKEVSTQTSRQADRYLRSCRDALDEAGVIVQEHDGDRYHRGRSLKVLVFEDDPELSEEKIVDTVRPSVYIRHNGEHRRIQEGEVIVGRPPKGTENHE